MNDIERVHVIDDYARHFNSSVAGFKRRYTTIRTHKDREELAKALLVKDEVEQLATRLSDFFDNAAKSCPKKDNELQPYLDQVLSGAMIKMKVDPALSPAAFAAMEKIHNMYCSFAKNTMQATDCFKQDTVCRDFFREWLGVGRKTRDRKREELNAYFDSGNKRFIPFMNFLGIRHEYAIYTALRERIDVDFKEYLRSRSTRKDYIDRHIPIVERLFAKKDGIDEYDEFMAAVEYMVQPKVITSKLLREKFGIGNTFISLGEFLCPGRKQKRRWVCNGRCWSRNTWMVCSLFGVVDEFIVMLDSRSWVFITLLATSEITNFFQEHLQKVSVSYDFSKANIDGGLTHLGITLSIISAISMVFWILPRIYYRSPRMCRRGRKPFDWDLAVVARRNRRRMNALMEEDKQVDPEIVVYFDRYDSENEDPEIFKLCTDLEAEERALEEDQDSVFTMRMSEERQALLKKRT
jgi:hypothetical protein